MTEEFDMRNHFRFALAAAGAVALLGLAGPVRAQPYPGMMGGYGPGYGMMGPGYGPGWMMNGYGPGYMMGPGYGMRGGYGPGYNRNQGNLNLSVDDVRTYLQNMIRNPNLKVGDVKEKDADTITADVVTKDNSLVQRFEFNRHSGFYQPEQ
jgi:hypothetical protein